jgi:RNA polymerase sigma factor (sigma-70 family)
MNLPAGTNTIPGPTYELQRCLKLALASGVTSLDLVTRMSDVPGDDAGLVQGCLRGEPEAIHALVDRFQADVYGLCLRVLRHRHDAEDVTQEVFLRIFRSLRRWDADRPLRPWVLGIAINRCRTWLAKRSRRPEPVDFLQDTAAGPPGDDSAELVREIQAAVDDLRPEYQNVFILFHEQAQPYDAIARALGRPVGTVKTWLHRARLEVFERLQRRGMISEVPHGLP